MKIKNQIKMVILTAALTASTAHSQEAITNFNSQMSNLRIINGQWFDLQSLPSVKLPPDFSYVTYGYNGVPNQPIILQGFLQGNPGRSVTFRNFPFDPNDFTPVHGVTGLQPNRSIYTRALKTSEVTNINVLGQTTSVDTVYDCGVYP